MSRELLADSGLEVVGVCVSGIGPCLLVADEAGTPLRPAILYGVDTRAEAEIVELTERFGAESILARGGSPLTTQAVVRRLGSPATSRRSSPRVAACSWRVLALWRLTGEYVLDHHSASQCDPMYDLLTGDWSGDWAGGLASHGVAFIALAGRGRRVRGGRGPRQPASRSARQSPPGRSTPGAKQ